MPQWSWLHGSGQPPGTPPTTPPPTGTPPPTTPPASTTPPPGGSVSSATGPGFGQIGSALAGRFPGMAAKMQQYGPQIQERLGEVFRPEMREGLAARFPGMAQGMERFRDMFPGGGTGTPPATPPAGGDGGGHGWGIGGGRLNHFGTMNIADLPGGMGQHLTDRWATIGGGQPMPTTLGDYMTAARTYRQAHPPSPGAGDPRIAQWRNRFANFLDRPRT